MAAQPVRTDPDAGIPDLIRRLTGDGKRLISDEVRLAKLEMSDSVHRAGKGATWLGVAFGVAGVMWVAVNVFMITFIAALANDHIWVGALLFGVVQLAIGAILVKRGMRMLARPSYTLEETREGLKAIVGKAGES
jgi:uncharacterized membrane protein YqjE